MYSTDTVEYISLYPFFINSQRRVHIARKKAICIRYLTVSMMGKHVDFCQDIKLSILADNVAVDHFDDLFLMDGESYI